MIISLSIYSQEYKNTNVDSGDSEERIKGPPAAWHFCLRDVAVISFPPAQAHLPARRGQFI